jgi:hypothetical protein
MRFSALRRLSAFFSHLLPLFALLPLIAPAAAQAADAPKAKTGPDVLLFTNGEKFYGKLDQIVDGKVSFKSDTAGKIKFKSNLLRAMHTTGSFAVIEKGVPVGRKKANLQVPIGTLSLQDGILTVATLRGSQKIPLEDIAYVVTGVSFERNVLMPQGLLQGITGSISAGLSTVRATQNSISVNTGIDLTRAVPAAAWLPPSSRTLLNFASTYGRITQPNSPSVTTNVLHGKLEEDEYFSRRLFVLQQAMFDHNIGQGLDLQQLYGIGIGYTPIKDTVQELDLSATVNYTRQQLAASDGTPATERDLIGSTFGDTYTRKLPRKIRLNQTASYLPAWNSPKDYSANVAVSVTIPIYKNFGFSTEVVDDYLNNPVVGFQGNSFQFNTALTYTIGSQ